MPSVARQRAQGGPSGGPRVPGLKRPCLESGRAWASATRDEEARAILAMSRRGGRSKVYRELLRQCRDGVLPADVRAVSSIGARLGITERQVRKHLAALEAEKWIVKVHHAGLRLPGQRGWTTTVIVLPALLPAVPLLPPAAREKARKLLLGELVRTALMTLGQARQLRQAVGPIEPSPPPASEPARPPPADNLSISTPMGLGRDSVHVGLFPSVSEISIASPYPLRTLNAVENPDHQAVRADARTCSEPSSGETAAAPPPARTRRSPDHLGGLKPSEVVAVLEAEGVPRSEAVQRATGFARTAAWRRWRRRKRLPEGRSVRRRALVLAVQRELARLRVERRQAGEDGEAHEPGEQEPSP